MRRPVRIVTAASAYFVFAFGGILIGWLILPILMLGVRDERRRMAIAQRTLHRGARFFLWYMNALRILRSHYPAASELVTPGRSAVVIANHPALLDVVFLAAVLPGFVTVAKAAMMDSPFVGRMLRMCGHICAPRGNAPAEGTIALQRTLDALASGQTVVIFPEGTRSPRGGLHPFFRGAFEAAVRTGVPLVPILISIEPSMLRKDQKWWDVGDRLVHYRMRALEPILPEDHGRARTLAQRVRAMYERELGIVDSAFAGPNEDGSRAAE
jgi:1-acyl-sn-glycerol-3-phosphate acyltransferase